MKKKKYTGKGLIDLKGKKIGRLIILERVENIKKQATWLTQCSCGIKKTIRSCDLLSNKVKSCGCKRIKHGMVNTRFYNIWKGMKKRINYKHATNYDRYGGRGIKHCKRWINFENFYDDMYVLYKEHSKKYGEKNTSIDRINNDGNYQPSNCRWATNKQQSLNKSNTIKK